MYLISVLRQYYRQGFGVFTALNGDVYEGPYEDGKKSGTGTYKFASGDIYSGQYRNDLRNGFGTYTTVNGDKFEGTYVDDLKHGFGKHWLSDGDYYEGEFRNNKYHGKFTEIMYTFCTTSFLILLFSTINKTGKGTLRYPNGELYEGEFKDDLKRFRILSCNIYIILSTCFRL